MAVEEYGIKIYIQDLGNVRGTIQEELNNPFKITVDSQAAANELKTKIQNALRSISKGKAASPQLKVRAQIDSLALSKGVAGKTRKEALAVHGQLRSLTVSPSAQGSKEKPISLHGRITKIDPLNMAEVNISGDAAGRIASTIGRTPIEFGNVRLSSEGVQNIRTQITNLIQEVGLQSRPANAGGTTGSRRGESDAESNREMRYALSQARRYQGQLALMQRNISPFGNREADASVFEGLSRRISEQGTGWEQLIGEIRSGEMTFQEAMQSINLLSQAFDHLNRSVNAVREEFRALDSVEAQIHRILNSTMQGGSRQLNETELQEAQQRAANLLQMSADIRRAIAEYSNLGVTEGRIAGGLSREGILTNIHGMMDDLTTLTEQFDRQTRTWQQQGRIATANQRNTLRRQMEQYLISNSRMANTIEGREIRNMSNMLLDQNLPFQSLQNMRNRFVEIDTAMRQTNNTGRAFIDTISNAYYRFGGWMLITNSLMSAIGVVRDMFSNVVELDSAMTELKKVTDETDATYSRFLIDAQDRAKAVGASYIDTVTATADFARLGYSIEDASKLADVALVYNNVADGIDGIGDASQHIISTMKAFGIEASNAMDIADKFNEIGNNFAITSGGVGEAMERSAAALSLSGTSIDEAVAMAAAMNEIVQNEAKTGQALKSGALFLRSAKTEAADAGIETEGMVESVSKLRDEFLALTGGRLDIQDTETTYKGMFQVYRELSQIWDALPQLTQQNILEKLGGKFHLPRRTAMCA